MGRSLQRSSGWPGIVISNARIMLPGRQLQAPAAGWNPVVALAALPHRGTVEALSKAGAVGAHQGSGRGVRDEPADPDLREHRYSCCPGTPRSVR